MRTKRIPDIITISLSCAGLTICVFFDMSALPWRLAGLGLGLLTFAAVSMIYLALRGVDGLGLGDAKLLGAAGAWLGPLYLAPLVLISSLLALAFMAILRLARGPLPQHFSLAFGPFLSVAFMGLWITRQIVGAGW